MPQPHILFLSFCTPSPTGSGWEQRAFRFVSAYASFAKVSCWIKVTHDDAAPERVKDVARLCADVKVLTSDDVYASPHHTRPGLYSYTKFKRRLLSLKPFLASEPYRKEFLRDLRQTVCSYELVHLDRFARYLRPLLGCRTKRTVCDLDEVPWNVRRPRQLHKKLAWRSIKFRSRVVRKWETFRYRRFFFRELNRFSTVYVCSKLEASELPINTPVCVAPNTVEVLDRESYCDCLTSATKRLLFVGNLNYPPNQDALRFFVDEVWLEINRCYPDCKFMIVGRALRGEGDEEFKQILERSDFELQTDVPDLSPIYCQADVCVAPIRYGGGTRVKIIEAFAYKRAVVSTRVGCEGLDVAHEEHLLVADDPKSFAKQCVRLLHDAPLRRRLSQAGYDYYLKNHTADAFNSVVATELRRLGMSI